MEYKHADIYGCTDSLFLTIIPTHIPLMKFCFLLTYKYIYYKKKKKVKEKPQATKSMLP